MSSNDALIMDLSDAYRPFHPKVPVLRLKHTHSGLSLLVTVSLVLLFYICLPQVRLSKNGYRIPKGPLGLPICSPSWFSKQMLSWHKAPSHSLLTIPSVHWIAGLRSSATCTPSGSGTSSSSLCLIRKSLRISRSLTDPFSPDARRCSSRARLCSPAAVSPRPRTMTAGMFECAGQLSVAHSLIGGSIAGSPTTGLTKRQ